MELELFEKLKEAYETTSHKFNVFRTAIESIQWDNQYEADGEIYFHLSGFTLMVQSLNPFDEKWKPSVIFSDGTYIEF